jgi:hypothetical protein
MTREATSSELQLLWSAVADADYIEDASDGHLGWAFLLDFTRQGGGALFPGFVGAIVYAENEVGPTAAWFYSRAPELADAWGKTFSPVAAEASR